MKSKIILILLIAASLFSGCSVWGVRGNGKIKNQKRDVAEFSRIEAGGAFSIRVVVGKPVSLKISAEENLLPLIKTSVSGKTLHIGSKKNLSPRKEIILEITTPTLRSIDVSGANNVHVKNIDTEEFDVELSGAGNIDLDGIVDKLSAELSGAGNIDARYLKANEVYISVSGAASADVFAKRYLDASVSGVGSIDYYGDPEKTKTNVSGVGSITRK